MLITSRNSAPPFVNEDPPYDENDLNFEGVYMFMSLSPNGILEHDAWACFILQKLYKLDYEFLLVYKCYQIRNTT